MMFDAASYGQSPQWQSQLPIGMLASPYGQQLLAQAIATCLASQQLGGLQQQLGAFGAQQLGGFGGQSPFGQQPFGQQPFGQQPFGHQPFGSPVQQQLAALGAQVVLSALSAQQQQHYGQQQYGQTPFGIPTIPFGQSFGQLAPSISPWALQSPLGFLSGAIGRGLHASQSVPQLAYIG